MTRIELPTSTPEERDKLEKEIREIKKGIKKPHTKVIKKRSCFDCWSCCSFLLLVLLALVIFVFIILAKTGFFQIPFFTDIFYKSPQPVYVVQAPFFNEDEKQKLAESFEQRIVEQAFSQVDPDKLKEGLISEDQRINLDLNIFESEITLLFRTGLTQGLEQEYKFEGSQVAITPSELEFFTHVLKPKDVYLTLGLKPTIKDGELNLELTKIKIGNLALPSALANVVVEYYLGNKIKEVSKSLFPFTKIESLTLTEGQINISGYLQVKDLEDKF